MQCISAWPDYRGEGSIAQDYPAYSHLRGSDWTSFEGNRTWQESTIHRGNDEVCKLEIM